MPTTPQVLAADPRQLAILLNQLAIVIEARGEAVIKKPFHEQLDEVERKGFDIYRRLTIDLSVARNLHLYEIAGAAMFIRQAANDPDAAADVRLWRSDLPAIPIRLGTQIIAPFKKFFITNAAQAGLTFDIFIATDPDVFKFIELPSLDADILAELQGSLTGTDGTGTVTTQAEIIASNAARRSVLVQADPTNTVDLMIGDSTAVAAGAAAFARLTPGQSYSADDYRGAIWAEAADAATATRYYFHEVG